MDFITINPEEDERLLIDKYEQETGTILYPAQDARILIQLIVYYASLVKTQFNDAAKLNLVEYSRAPFLDFLGRYKNCERTAASKGKDLLKININTTFSDDLTITKGLQVKTKDGKYIFETTKDLVINAGETSGTVEIESMEAVSEVNNYKAGDINTVISSSFSFIDSVENLNGVQGGSDEEEDEHYIERIILSPEGYSVAGPEAAYRYFALSAHPSIKDAAIDVPKEDASVLINDVESILTGETSDNNLYSVEINYKTGEMKINLKQSLSNGTVIKVKIPHPYELDVYTLTEGETSQVVLDAVETALKDVRPLSDYVVAKSAQIKTFKISGTVYMYSNADEEKVKETVNEVLNNFLGEFKNRLNKSVIKSKIITEVCSIEGVYDFKPTSPSSNLTAAKNICYTGEIGTLKYERTSYAE